MDLLVEKGNNKTYLSQLGFLVTSFEEGSPTIARNSTNIQGRSGSVDFGGWHESKKVKLEGFYRAEDQYEEETLKERLFALLSDPEGIYITEMRGEIGQGFERPGETEGEVYEHMMTRPSHKRFYVYASSIENEFQGNVGGTVLYKTSVEFTTLKLPYGESVPRDLDVNNGIIPYSGTVPCNQLEQGFSIEFTAKEGGSGLKIDINGKEFVYDGQVYDGDVLKLSGYEYTKNGLSVVRTTNKAYFKLLPGVSNTLSASLHGTIKVLDFQNLYA